MSVDRWDAMTIGAMLATSLAVALNIVFLQADAAAVMGRGPLVLIPIFAGVAVSLSGFVENLRRHGRDMVLVSRIWTGSLVYLALSAACSALFQPRFA
jgi:hypothetical protein